MSIQQIELDEVEQGLFDSIIWDGPNSEDQMERSARLARLLLEGDRIPRHRMDWLKNPHSNFGGYGRSRFQRMFAEYGSVERTLRSDEFKPYIRYFVCGPIFILPQSTIDGFIRIFEDDHGTSGQVKEEDLK